MVQAGVMNKWSGLDLIRRDVGYFRRGGRGMRQLGRGKGQLSKGRRGEHGQRQGSGQASNRREIRFGGKSQSAIRDYATISHRYISVLTPRADRTKRKKDIRSERKDADP